MVVVKAEAAFPPPARAAELAITCSRPPVAGLLHRAPALSLGSGEASKAGRVVQMRSAAVHLSRLARVRCSGPSRIGNDIMIAEMYRPP